MGEQDMDQPTDRQTPHRLTAAVRGLWRSEPPWLIRDGVIALVIGAVLLLSQNQLDERRSDRQDALEAARAQHAETVENLRFVRELASHRTKDSVLLLP